MAYPGQHGRRRRVPVRLTVAASAAAGVLSAGIAAACSAQYPQPAQSLSAVRTLPQPETASQVAAQIGASGFVSEGPAPLAGVQTSGTAMYHGRKIGIDTFATAAVRDQWVKMSASFGVSPLVEGTNWVAYWSVTQGAE
jgi:hypothetical protein